MAWCIEDGYYRRCGYWHDWGRWVALGILLAAAVAFFFMFACLSARRRRKRGLQPFMGTGWAGGPPPYGHPSQYQQPPPGAPPQYTPAGGYYGGGEAQNYYGGPPQQTGIELQQPQNAYQGGNNTGYAPPPQGHDPSHKV